VLRPKSVIDHGKPPRGSFYSCRPCGLFAQPAHSALRCKSNDCTERILFRKDPLQSFVSAAKESLHMGAWGVRRQIAGGHENILKYDLKFRQYSRRPLYRLLSGLPPNMVLPRPHFPELTSRWIALGTRHRWARQRPTDMQSPRFPGKDRAGTDVSD